MNVLGRQYQIMSLPCDGKRLDNRDKFSSHSGMVIPRRCQVAPGTASRLLATPWNWFQEV